MQAYKGAQYIERRQALGCLSADLRFQCSSANESSVHMGQRKEKGGKGKGQKMKTKRESPTFFKMHSEVEIPKRKKQYDTSKNSQQIQHLEEELTPSEIKIQKQAGKD